MSPERGIEGASAAEGAKEHERQKPAAHLVQEEREEGQHFAGGDVWTSEDAHVAREAPGLRAGALSQAGGGSLSLREEVLCTDGTGLDMDCAQEGQGRVLWGVGDSPALQAPEVAAGISLYDGSPPGARLQRP